MFNFLNPARGPIVGPLWLYRFLPFLRWWPMVNRRSLRADALAGLSGAVIVLPQGVAFATIAGLPPEYGLYAAMVPAAVAALFGSSWHLVSGPTTAISIVIFASVSPLAEPGSAAYISLVLTLTFLTGVIQLTMGLARMGGLVNFISHTVVIGFTAGAAVLIAASQLKNFLGVEVTQGAHFYETLVQIARQLTTINPFVTTVAVLTMVSGVLIKRFLPRVPYMIVAMVVGSLVALALDAVFGNATTGIRTIGALPQSLPPLSSPDFSLDVLRQMAPAALAVSVLALTEAVSIARAIAVRSEQRIDGNQEFIGQGLANIAGSFFSAYASSGSFNRSGLNHAAGAVTPLAAVLASGFLVVILLLVAPLAAYLPIAAMAGVLILVAWGLIDFHHIGVILRANRSETGVLIATFLATLFIELEFAIFVGVTLSLMLYLNRTAHPAIRGVMPAEGEGQYHFELADGRPECAQLKILRISGSIFFGAVDHVRRALTAIDEQEPRRKHVLIAASRINFVDLAGAEMLGYEARRRRRLGGGLYYYRLNPSARACLGRAGSATHFDEAEFYTTGEPVIARIYPKLDIGICSGCTNRVFRECQTHLPDGSLRPEVAAAAAQAPGGLAANAPEPPEVPMAKPA